MKVFWFHCSEISNLTCRIRCNLNSIKTTTPKYCSCSRLPTYLTTSTVLICILCSHRSCWSFWKMPRPICIGYCTCHPLVKNLHLLTHSSKSSVIKVLYKSSPPSGPWGKSVHFFLSPLPFTALSCNLCIWCSLFRSYILWLQELNPPHFVKCTTWFHFAYSSLHIS